MSSSIYRARKGANPDSFKEARIDIDTRRPPANVPYVVDNLWAWTRPDEYPDRRKSKFASPDYRQALRSIGCSTNETENVFSLEFVGGPIIAQLPGCEDAKHHRDCKALRSELMGKLGKFEWSSRPMSEKHPAGQLFQPCLTAPEVDHLFETVDELRPHREALREEVEYWSDMKLVTPGTLANDEVGEILIEFRDATEGDGYWRRPVDV